MFFVLIAIIPIALLIIFTAINRKPTSTYKHDSSAQNPMEGKKVRFVHNNDEPENADGVRGHLEIIGEAECNRSFYDRFWKRGIDIVLSSLGLIILSPVFLIIYLVILIDDPGNVFFAQKRTGKNKEFFRLHKFRSMKMSTPRDVPTHMLDNPDQYITRIGRILRKTSLDELPQLGDVLIGTMSFVGPRPGLWNQDLLTAERDKYGANDIRPGLTGWAQINGRDELEIPEKAKLDGDYTAKLKAGGFAAFYFDCKCFFGTFFSVIRSEGIVEGGTGKIKEQKKQED